MSNIDLKHLNNFKLCYVCSDVAYFTTLPLADQWGDDWDDAPYEHNAGLPYEWYEESKHDEYQIYSLIYKFPDYHTPGETMANSPYSVNSINNGNVAWLSNPFNSKIKPVHAGVTPQEFAVLIQKAGGTIYLPVAIES